MSVETHRGAEPSTAAICTVFETAHGGRVRAPHSWLEVQNAIIHICSASQMAVMP